LAGRSESSTASIRHAEIVYSPKCRSQDWSRHQLGDALAAANFEGRRSEVRKDDLDLTAIVLVDCTRRIETCYAVLEGKPRSRAHLNFEPSRNGDCKSRRDGMPVSRCN